MPARLERQIPWLWWRWLNAGFLVIGEIAII
jgi:hypothetical protein